MDIPINAKVFCANDECGRTTCVIINPIKKEITHLVVRERGLVGFEHLVPIEQVLATSPERSHCAILELSWLEWRPLQRINISVGMILT